MVRNSGESRRARDRREWQNSPLNPVVMKAVRAARERATAWRTRMDVTRLDQGAHGTRGTAYIVDGLEPGEPVFVMRARDAQSLPLLSLYGAMIDQGDLFDVNRRMALKRDQSEIARWRRDNADRVRDPD